MIFVKFSIGKQNMFLATCRFTLALGSNSNLVKRLCHSATDALQKHHITFESCGMLYQKWKSENKFRHVPHTGLKFTIDYFDSQRGCRTGPTVVALHGAPGSCEDFSKLIKFFENKSARILAPTFPDFSTYRPGIFRHSKEEKAVLIADFLDKLGIKEINTLICHSSSIYAGLELCLSSSVSVKSLIMLNPGTHSTKSPALRNFSGMKRMVKASESPIIFKVLNIIAPPIMRILQVPVRLDNFTDPLLSATTMAYGGIPESKEKFLCLIRNKMPLLYAFSEDDKLVGKRCAYELAKLLGVKDSEIYFYNEKGYLTKSGIESSTLKVLCFEKGSHYVFWKHPEIINKEIEDFIFSVHKQL